MTKSSLSMTDAMNICNVSFRYVYEQELYLLIVGISRLSCNIGSTRDRSPAFSQPIYPIKRHGRTPAKWKYKNMKTNKYPKITKNKLQNLNHY